MTRLVSVLMCLALSVPALAHRPSDSYLTLERDSKLLHIQWAIALRDLEVAVGLDSNADGNISWGELQAAAPRVNAYALRHIELFYAGTKQQIEVAGLQVAHKSDGAYAVLRLQGPRPGERQQIGIAYRLLFALDPTHRGLVAYDDGRHQVTRVASPDTPRIDFPVAGTSSWRVFGDYLLEGVWHIWIGFDHILFLLTLLLPSVLVYRQRAWAPVEHPRAALGDIVKTVTAFTLAHSITLALATSNLLVLPSRLVETAIAFSVLVAALNNLHPLFPASRWQLAFVFGLVHGFGFAGVLADLGLPATALMTALAGFNLGVEAGQLTIVLVLLPGMLLLRRNPLYQRVVLAGGSVAAASIAAAWTVQRAFA